MKGTAFRPADVALVLGLPIVALSPMVLSGFPAGHDWLFELVRAAEFPHAIKDGQLPPLWGPDLYRGFGAPIFLYYGPLYSAVVALGTTLGATLPGSAVLALLAVALLGTAGAWRLGHELSASGDRRTTARLTSIFFALQPYLLCDALVRNACAEFLALELVPWSLLGTVIVRRRLAGGVLITAFGLAGVVLAHNLTALWAAALTIVLLVAMHLAAPDRRATAWGIGGIMLGIGLSAFFWLPALAWRQDVRIAELTTGTLDYRIQFQAPCLLFDPRPFWSPGIGTWLVLAAAGLLLAVRPPAAPVPRAVLLVSLGVATVATALQLPVAAPAWAAVPVLPLYQFPWRFGGALAVAALLGLPVTLDAVLGGATRAVRYGAALSLAGLALLGAVPRWRDYQAHRPEELAAIEQNIRPEVIRAEGLPATVGDEYLPRFADRSLAERSGGSGLSVLFASPGVTVRKVPTTGHDEKFEVRSSGQGSLVLSTWFHPAWTADSGAGRLPTDAAHGNCLRIAIPPGDHVIDLRLRQPLSRRVGIAASLVSVIALVVSASRLSSGRARMSDAPASES